jgi:hypothetical protein
MKMTLGGVPGPDKAAPSTKLSHLHTYTYRITVLHSLHYTNYSLAYNHIYIFPFIPMSYREMATFCSHRIATRVGILRETCSI